MKGSPNAKRLFDLTKLHNPPAQLLEGACITAVGSVTVSIHTHFNIRLSRSLSYLSFSYLSLALIYRSPPFLGNAYAPSTY